MPLVAGTGVNGGLPDMAFGADPPGPYMRTCCDHLGRQSSVEGRVPLGGEGWIGGGQVVKSGQHLFSGTVGTAGVSCGSHPDCGDIIVSERTTPPDFAFGAEGDVLRRQRPIFAGVPLSGQGWVLARQVIGADYYRSIAANGAAAAVDTGADGCLPFMSLFAPPPNLPLTPRQHAIRCQREVFNGMALLDQIGIPAGQIVVSGPYGPVRTVWAAGMAGGAVIYRYLPAMAFFAPPPDLLGAAIRQTVRGQREIGLVIPLGEQIPPILLTAERR